jgi:GWxTD domain-containing protein
MKRIIIVFYILFFIVNPIFGGITKKPQALFSHASFLMAGKTPYLETYLLVKGNSIHYKKNALGKFQGTIEVILTVFQENQPRYIDKYNLLSPESDDSSNIAFNFIDQQRIPLSNGKYTLSISIKDVNSISDTVKAVEQINISFPRDSICLSELQMVDNYSKTIKLNSISKGGYDLIPHISELYGQSDNALTFYTEVYHTLSGLGESEKFLLTAYIEQEQPKQPLNQYRVFKRFQTAEVNIWMNEFNISDLPNGNYQLVIEARDKENNLITSRKQHFTRSVQKKIEGFEQLASISYSGSFVELYKNVDSLAEHIRCLYPISIENEKNIANNVVKLKDFKMMQQFFLSFWRNRDAAQPQAAWEKYKLEVIKVNKTFSTSIKKGYLSDRGRIYLQYGPPDNRTQALREPSAYPYEIWQYYKLGKQSNRRFVFYQPDLVTNDYQLIHSDALGEIMNDNWQFLIMKRDTQTNDIDATQTDSHFGSQLQQNFQTPR